MRTPLTLFLCIFFPIISIAQTSNNNVDNLPYVVGSESVPGYQIQINTVPSVKTENKQKFNNGKNAPILQTYVSNKKQYIGGILESENNEKTIILDILLIEQGSTIKFVITGKKFSRDFTLETGVILKETDKVTVFYTQGIGIWKIYKK